LEIDAALGVIEVETMTDAECVAFLQWCLPQMGMRWRGFRKVRRQVRKRIVRRMRALGFDDLSAYRVRLENRPAEWAVLDSFCRISVSRFFRDKAVFRHLGTEVLPMLAESARRRNDRRLRCWSIGCASGEEPYTLRIIWRMQLAARFPQLDIDVFVTDADDGMLERAQRAKYPYTAVKDLPDDWIAACFEQQEQVYRLLPQYRKGVHFHRQDIRQQTPVDSHGNPAVFDLVLCRNLVFTYFDEPTQRSVLPGIARHIAPGGFLVIGKSETLPPGEFDLECRDERLKIFQKAPRGSA